MAESVNIKTNNSSEMNSLAVAGAEYARVLKISQELDKLIVMYHRAAA